jgi:NitT/TauT family transport system permease protein
LGARPARLTAGGESAASARGERCSWLSERSAANLFVLFALVAWQLAALAVPSFLLPGPFVVAMRLERFLLNGRELAYLGESIAHVLGAIAISFVIGGILALFAHYWPATRFAVQRRISPFLNAFPGVGWTLLAVMWLGIGASTVLLAISAVLIPFALINLTAGLDALDRDLVEMARSFSHSRVRSFLLVVMPLLYPFIFATLRIMFGVAWKVTLTAELFGGDSGLGYLVNLARQEFDTATILAAIVLLIAFVYGTDRFVFAPLQARLRRQDAR